MRIYLYLLLKAVTITWLLSGCNGTEKNSANNLIETKINGVKKIHLRDRVYYIATPSENYDAQKSYKLLLAFHGSGQGAKGMQSMVSIESASDKYIVVYPQSKVEEWNEGCNCNKPHRLGIDDLSFVEDVVADIKTKYNIIANELYAVGFSQGGLFTQNLMCNSKLKFNAIVSVASPMSEPLSELCDIKNSTNYMMVHGTDDQTLPFKGFVHSNFGLISSESAISLIAKENLIDTELIIEKNGGISKYIYKTNKHINQLVAIEGGQHSWGFSSFNTTNEVMNFFDSVSNYYNL